MKDKFNNLLKIEIEKKIEQIKDYNYIKNKSEPIIVEFCLNEIKSLSNIKYLENYFFLLPVFPSYVLNEDNLSKKLLTKYTLNPSICYKEDNKRNIFSQKKQIKLEKRDKVGFTKDDIIQIQENSYQIFLDFVKFIKEVEESLYNGTNQKQIEAFIIDNINILQQDYDFYSKCNHHYLFLNDKSYLAYKVTKDNNITTNKISFHCYRTYDFIVEQKIILDFNIKDIINDNIVKEIKNSFESLFKKLINYDLNLKNIK